MEEIFSGKWTCRKDGENIEELTTSAIRLVLLICAQSNMKPVIAICLGITWDLRSGVMQLLLLFLLTWPPSSQVGYSFWALTLPLLPPTFPQVSSLRLPSRTLGSRGVCAERGAHLGAIVHFRNKTCFAVALNQKEFGISVNICVKSAQLPFQDWRCRVLPVPQMFTDVPRLPETE